MEFIVRFYDGNKKNAYVAKSLLELSDSYVIEPNLIEDDTTENYTAFFSEDKIKDLEYILITLGATKLYKNQELRSTPCSYGIFGVAISEINRQINNKYGGLLMMESKWSYEKLEAAYGIRVSYDIFRKYCKKFREIHLSAYTGGFRTTKGREEFKEEIKVVDVIIERMITKLKLGNVLDVYFYLKEIEINMVEEYRKTYQEISLTPSKIKKHNIRLEQDYMNLIASGTVRTGFVAQAKMFELIKKRYKEAIPEHSPNFLEKQRYDVFIPELNVAFEYQGIQHYKAVEYFGGKKGLAETKKRDERKRELSYENNVRIIYWEYFEPVNDVVLDIKLSEVLA